MRKEFTSTRNSDFICTAIKGHYSPGKEDRLTQVFIACFNHSLLFKKVALRFFGLPYDGDAKAIAQVQSKDGDGRLDIVVLNSHAHEILAIENKIDAVLTGRQLGKYRKAGHKKVVAIARKYPQLDFDLRRYDIYRWSEFYRELEVKINSAPTKECLLGTSFLGYLEELNMTGLKRITKKELAEACGTISIIGDTSRKYKSRVLKQVNPFSIFNEVLKYFEYVYSEAHNDPVLRHRFGKDFRFNPYMDLDLGKDGAYETPCINFSFYSHWRGRSKKIAAVGLKFVIHPTNGRLRGFHVWRFFKNRDVSVENKIDNAVYHGGVLSPEKLAKAAICRWKRWVQ